MREFTCIICPRGCSLKVDDNGNVTGNFCPRGKEYAINEITNPKRTITTTIRVKNRKDTVVSVKTTCAVPKGMIFQIMDVINTLSVDAPTRIGDVVLMDLASCFEERMAGSVDVLVFNPPYVVTDTEELQRAVRDRDIAAAWAGGVDGTEVLNRLIPRLPTLLSPKGTFYLVAIADNKPTEISKRMLTLGFAPKIIMTTVAASEEKLFVIRFTRLPRKTKK